MKTLSILIAAVISINAITSTHGCHRIPCTTVTISDRNRPDGEIVKGLAVTGPEDVVKAEKIMKKMIGIITIYLYLIHQ